MPQNLATICPHDAEEQVRVPGMITKCRKCGAPLEPEARAVAQKPTAAPNISPAGIAAGYPGESNA
jgi:hypothetical protein